MGARSAAAAVLVLRQNRAYRAVIGAGRWLLVGLGPIALLLHHASDGAQWLVPAAILVVAVYVLILAALCSP